MKPAHYQLKEDWKPRKRTANPIALWMRHVSKILNSLTVTGGHYFYDGNRATLECWGMQPPWDFYPSLVNGKWVETNIGSILVGGQEVEIAALSYDADPRTAIELTGSTEWVYAAVDRVTPYSGGSIKHSSTRPVSTSNEIVHRIARYDADSVGVYSLTRLCLTDAQYDLPTR